MLRFFLNLILICAAAVFISMQDGTVQLRLPGRFIELDVQTALALAFIVLVWWWGIAKLWFYIKYGFSRRRERRLRQAQDEGIAAFTLSLNALAGGDLRLAQRALKKAHKLLGDKPLVMWLEAEMAMRRGEEKVAHKAYQVLASSKEGATLGWRGLLRQQPQQGISDVLRLTGEALAVSSIASRDFAHELRIMAFAQQRDWAEALGALRAAEKSGAFTRARVQRLTAVLSLKQGETLFDTNRDDALRLLRAAHKAQSDYLPVVHAYVKALLRIEDESLAHKVLVAAWLVAPQLDLLPLFREAHAGDDSLARLTAFERFALKRKDHVATHLALARLCLDAKILGRARTHAEKALDIRATREGYMMLADVDRADGAHNADAARRALGAPPAGLYVCSACTYAASVWDAVCPHCSKVGTLEWQDELDERTLARAVDDVARLQALS
ncbi:MAG: heme biosynthesis HemY N-terminal domain-containing protein [Bdellovibrionales bacterium]